MTSALCVPFFRPQCIKLLFSNIHWILAEHGNSNVSRNLLDAHRSSGGEYHMNSFRPSLFIIELSAIYLHTTFIW